MSKLLNFPLKHPIENKIVKDNFNESMKQLYFKCIEDLQKTDEYMAMSDRITTLTNSLIFQYKADEKVVDELVELIMERTTSEFEYVNYHIPDLFFNNLQEKS